VNASAAGGGAPDDASQGFLLVLRLPCLRVLSNLLSWSLSRVQLYRLCSSSDLGTYVSDAHNHMHKLFHLSGSGECHPSFMEATGGSVKILMGANELTQPQHRRNKHREPNKQRPRQTDGQIETHTYTHTHTHTHTYTHLGSRSATCWAHLGGSHNERGTVATHTQVPTRRKQMRLHVGSPLV
jgi:hypothetical protein